MRKGTVVAAAAEPAREGSSRRIQRKRGRRVEEIVRAAADLFGERGYDAVNLEDVADALDVTKGSLYYYFASKSELGTAAIEQLGNEWIDRLQQLVDGHGGDAPEVLRTLIGEHLRIAVRDYPAVHRLFLVPRDWPAELADRIKDLRRRHDLVFRRVLEWGVASGDFAIDHLDVTLQCMHAAMTQAPRWCVRLPQNEVDAAIDAVTATLMRMVLPTDGADRG